MKLYKKVLLIIYCAIICICMSVCGKNVSEEERMNPIVTTSSDLKLVEKMFPTLEGAVALEMEQLKYGGSEDAEKLAGPTDYIYRGYITLSDEMADHYDRTFDFAETEPKVLFEAIKERAGCWKYSFEFSKQIIPAGYVGTVWIDGNTLLFDYGTM